MRSEFENWHSNSKDKSTSSAFAAGWMCQQSKIDELNQHIKRLESKLDSLGADRQELVGQVNDLQKQNAWLSDVAER